MKLIISLSLISLPLFSSANAVSVDFTNSPNVEVAQYPGGPGKKSRRSKRINKKRKRKCNKWGRKSYAG